MWHCARDAASRENIPGYPPFRGWSRHSQSKTIHRGGRVCVVGEVAMKSKLVNLAAAMALSFLAIGQAKADAVSVTYYNNFVETPGVGISFSDPFLTDSISGIRELRDISGPGTPNFPSGSLAFGADYTATIIVPTSGTYTFGFGSDDAGYLFFGGNLIGFEAGPNGYPGLAAC